uniref:Uncharacterized protein n=1 Tax=Knipowitschia caucasica TaxID=637954 RepID=A0AAV2MIV6_KNICA
MNERAIRQDPYERIVKELQCLLLTDSLSVTFGLGARSRPRARVRGCVARVPETIKKTLRGPVPDLRAQSQTSVARSRPRGPGPDPAWPSPRPPWGGGGEGGGVGGGGGGGARSLDCVAQS